jgi:predicted Fe-Mo cluster-binding NifX family protein
MIVGVIMCEASSQEVLQYARFDRLLPAPPQSISARKGWHYSSVPALAYPLLVLPGDMKLMVPVLRGRISSVLDVARHFLIVDTEGGEEKKRQEVLVENTQIVARAKKLVDMGTQVLICGAISWPLEAMLVSAGVHVIPNTCGMVEEVIEAFLSGQFTEQAFLMPGCRGRRRRLHNRHSRDNQRGS